MTPDWLSHLASNPWLIAYLAGVLTGVQLQRRLVRWALGGPSR